MKAGEPPDGGDVVQGEGKLVAAEDDVEGGIIVEFVVELESDGLVGLFDGVAVIEGVVGADEIEFVGGVGRDLDEPLVCGLGVSLRPIMSKLMTARVVFKGRSGCST